MESDSIQELPFEMTPQISRLLQELSDFYDEFYVEETGKPITLRTYKGDEKPTDKKENNVFDLIDYLNTIGATEDAGKSPNKIIPAEESDTGKDFYYIEYYTLKILNIEPIRKLLGEAAFVVPVLRKIQARLITMDGNGDFYRGKQHEVISFRNKEDGAYQIFVAIYKLTDGAGGRVKFADISRFMKERFRKEVGKKTITNAIDNTINRKRLMPKITPEGRVILERDGSGESIVFNNPQL